SVALVLYAVRFVSHEHWIYFWDWSGYWRLTLELAARLAVDPRSALAAIASSVRTDDYNLTPVAPLAPAALALRGGRSVYVATIAVASAIPAGVPPAAFPRGRLAPEGCGSAAGSFVGFAAIALLPALWTPVLIGFPDVVGVIAICLVWLLVRLPIE